MLVNSVSGENKTARMRIWRALKASGAAALGIDAWAGIEVDLDHRSLDGVPEDHLRAALVAGCSAVQVGTSCFGDPALLARLPAELDALLDSAGIALITDLIGALQVPGQVAVAPAAPS